MDGQPLYVKLTTFETADGREIFSLYHDHNITTAEVMKKGLLAGPDPVTNRAVTQEALQKTVYTSGIIKASKIRRLTD